jgi:uncharacterized membrane protein YphA (DoxX/SURF4 family)
MHERVPLAVLLPLRFLLALILIFEGAQKFSSGWLHGDALHAVTQKYLDAGVAYGFFMPFLKSAHAHPKIFGTLVTLGELFVGSALFVGVVTRLASFIGFLLMAAIAGVGGQGLAPPGNALLAAVILFTFLLAPPGRFLGLDQRIRNRLPRFMA